MRRLSTYLGLVIGSFLLVAFVNQPQQWVTSAWNQDRNYGAAGTTGSALPLIDAVQDASSDGSTESTYATASLTCANTGNVVITGYNQITVYIAYVYGAATDVRMECDLWNDNGQWHTIRKLDSSSVSTVRTWTELTTADTNIVWNFNANADLLRCRFWSTSGNSSDTVKVNLRLAYE